MVLYACVGVGVGVSLRVAKIVSVYRCGCCKRGVSLSEQLSWWVDCESDLVRFIQILFIKATTLQDYSHN